MDSMYFVIYKAMANQRNRLKKAGDDLQKILEDLRPYIRRPVVVEPTTRGKWVRNDGKFTRRLANSRIYR